MIPLKVLPCVRLQFPWWPVGAWQGEGKEGGCKPLPPPHPTPYTPTPQKWLPHGCEGDREEEVSRGQGWERIVSGQRLWLIGHATLGI